MYSSPGNANGKINQEKYVSDAGAINEADLVVHKTKWERSATSSNPINAYGRKIPNSRVESPKQKREQPNLRPTTNKSTEQPMHEYSH